MYPTSTAVCARVVCPAFGHHVRSLFTLVLVGLLAFTATRLRAAQLLPGVYGYGADRVSATAPTANSATSGTRVIKVTTLADSTSNATAPAGSLRAAIIDPDPNPRFVVFEVSGVIQLLAHLTVANGNITIAGQTAPGDGIALHGGSLNVTASNVLIQHLRIRPGDNWLPGLVNQGRDASAVSHATALVRNVVFDHCTFAWSVDEVASTWGSWEDVTFYRCIFAEPLNVSIHLDEATFDVDPIQNGNQNEPWQAEALTATPSSGVTVVTPPTVATGLAIKDAYETLEFTANTQYVDYTVPLVNPSPSRGGVHIVIAGITGPDRAKFIATLRTGSTVHQTSEEFDMYSATPGLKTFVAKVDESGYTIPANTASMTVRLTVSGWTSTRRKLGVDLVSFSQAHGMGGLYSAGGTSGAGRIAVIGSIYAHVKERGPWSAAREFVFANNVLYNRSNRFLMIGGSQWSTVPVHAAIMGNTFIEGRSLPINHSAPAMKAELNPLAAGSLIYENDNVHNRGTLTYPPKIDAVLSQDFDTSTNPTATINGIAGYVPLPQFQAYEGALMFAGAHPRNRDSMEARIVDDIAVGAANTTVATRQGKVKNSVAEAGTGWPVLPTPTRTLTAPAAGDTDGDGYSDIEEWLHAFSDEVEGRLSPAGALQAEAAVMGGGVTLQTNHLGFHGEGFVDFPVGTSPNGTLQFNNVNGGTGGPKLLRIRYAIASGPRTGQIVVNGGSPQPITFNATGAFNAWRTMDVAITLNSGTSNTIVLKSTGQDLGNIDEIWFPGAAAFDDFQDGNADGWTTFGGSWSVATTSGVSVLRQADPALIGPYAMLGSNWDEQSISADVKVTTFGQSSSWVGFVTRYTDLGNYYYAKLTATTAEIKKLVNGEPIAVGAPVSHATAIGVTKTVRFEVIGNQLKLFINGGLVASGTDDSHSAGKAGLLMYRTAAEYDNVHADPTPAGAQLVFDDFADGNDNGWIESAPPAAWSVVSQVYKQTDTGLTTTARATTGGNWSDQVVSASMKPVSFAADGKWFGVLARYIDLNNYYYFKLARPNVLELKKLVNNTPTTIATGTYTLTANTTYQVKLEVIGNSLRAYINDALVMRANDTQFSSGAAGAGVMTYGTSADVDNVLMTAP